MLSTRSCTVCMPVFFFFNDTATTEIYTLSLHDALPISDGADRNVEGERWHGERRTRYRRGDDQAIRRRSEEHTSELQSQSNLVCRLLLEKKKKKTNTCPPFCESLLSVAIECSTREPLAV